MKRFSALVVDDESLARKRILRLLGTESDIEVIGECSNGKEAVSFLNREAPDLMFLDVQMPEMDGFDVLRAIGPRRVPAVVFVTAFDGYALQAFEVNALDYLLKPFDERRFREALDRVRDRLSHRQETEMSDRLAAIIDNITPAKSNRGRIAIKTGGKVMFLNMNDIDWVEAADNYACLHCGGATHVLRETMHSLESKLDRSIFVRIHRSIIVNMDRIAEMQPWFRGDYLVILKDGTKLKLSRTYRDVLSGTLLAT
jgi:two-component system, LytTR family, response regulator